VGRVINKIKTECKKYGTSKTVFQK